MYRFILEPTFEGAKMCYGYSKTKQPTEEEFNKAVKTQLYVAVKEYGKLAEDMSKQLFKNKKLGDLSRPKLTQLLQALIDAKEAEAAAETPPQLIER